jgi:DNA-binding MarR family transcriptional regulator
MSVRPLGPALRRAWVGYQQLIDQAMAEAGFPDRQFPDGRVLRLCAHRRDMTAAAIGRELGITRQGAGKIVAELHRLGYVDVEASATDGRQKVVVLSGRGRRYLDAHHRAVRATDETVAAEIGEQAMGHLRGALDLLDPGDGRSRLRAQLSRAGRLATARVD